MGESQYLEVEPSRQSDGGLRELIAELNMEVIQCSVAAVPGLRECWLALEGAARQRLAACPFLLVDAAFARPELWATLREPAVREAVPVRTLLANRSALPTPLLQRVLLLAWHLARTSPTGARLLLGMSGNCASVVASCRLADLEALAERRPGWIRPRWEQRPDVWRAWMSAAARNSARSLERLRLWGLQTLAAELRGQRD